MPVTKGEFSARLGKKSAKNNNHRGKGLPKEKHGCDPAPKCCDIHTLSFSVSLHSRRIF